MTPTIQDRILQALGTYLKRDPTTIPLDAVLRDDLGLDSMATIELLYRVEEAFDLQIPDQDLQGLQSVQDVVRYVEGRLSHTTLLARAARSGSSGKSSAKRTKSAKKRGR